MFMEVIVKDFSVTTWPRILKFCITIRYDKLYCVLKNQLHIAYKSFYLYILFLLQCNEYGIFIKEQCLNTLFILWPYER